MSTETEQKPSAQAEAQPAELKDEIIETDHSIVIDGETIAYRATAGRMVLKTEEGKAKAAVFFVAYTRKDADPATRPLTVSFNGGPGSSSVWMHLGLLGPRRVLSGDVGALAKPPYRLADNELSLLTVSDLVFIDPVSTGYSRPAPGEEAKQFHGLQQDVESVGEFIRLYVTRYKRWSSPKFLIGESYGTTRASALAGHLQERFGMFLNGIMLVSAVLNFQTIEFTTGNDLPYVLYLPSYAATAWYHQRLQLADQQMGLQPLIDDARAFVSSNYLAALYQGDALSDGERQSIATQLARLTGLSVDYILRANLRIEHMRFCKELLRDQRRTVGRLDSRFAAADRDAAGEHFEFDPSYAAIHGAYSGTLNAYVREELKFTSDLPYELLAGLYETWDYSKHQNQFVDVSETLRSAMTQNPALQVIVANGYFDLATPFAATEYTFNHLALEPHLRGNIRMTYYEAGHMMYVHEPSLRQLAADLHEFVRSSV